MRVSLIIPALNEADCIGPLLAELPLGLVDQIIVVDNGSTDGTGEVAQSAGAEVVVEERRGYGYACTAGVAAARGDVLVFMDGDGSFIPAELAVLVQLIDRGEADLALGSRMLGGMTPGAMPGHQAFGNRLVARLLRILYGVHLTDLGPFRAIRRDLLEDLDMRERTYGWPVEMMVKAARRHAVIIEAPVTYRPRLAGQSKVGGTVRGTVLAGYRILTVVFRYALAGRPRPVGRSKMA
ncbi:MAG: glycosyltransferase family 2 protein [Caldilineales bacterium]|nr:glycosyltransferase family 2 protein [Caldilineales bacterium]